MTCPSVLLSESPLERALAWQITATGLPAPEREARLIEGRRFRADFAWPDQRLVVEVEGGSWIAGRHSQGRGFESDCVKGCELAVRGYRVLRVTGAMIESGVAIDYITRCLA